MEKTKSDPWFGRKRIGWGWGLPRRWEGWVVVALYLLSVWALQSLVNLGLVYFLLLGIDTVLLLVIAWVTSGKPQWGSWWDKKDKN